MRISVLLLGLILLQACATHNEVRVSHTKDISINSLAVVVPETQGDFELLYDRARSTATGAAMFGLIGAAVSEGYNSSNDSKKESYIAKDVQSQDYNQILRNSLTETFREDSSIQVKHFNSRSEVVGEGIDAVAYVGVEEYGFSFSNQNSENLSPYVVLTIKVESSSGQVIWDNREKFVGESVGYFYELKRDGAIASRSLKELFDEVGSRVSYNIIYQ
jgi:hypothetical protein